MTVNTIHVISQCATADAVLLDVVVKSIKILAIGTSCRCKLACHSAVIATQYAAAELIACIDNRYIGNGLTTILTRLLLILHLIVRVAVVAVIDVFAFRVLGIARGTAVVVERIMARYKYVMRNDFVTCDNLSAARQGDLHTVSVKFLGIVVALCVGRCLRCLFFGSGGIRHLFGNGSIGNVRVPRCTLRDVGFLYRRLATTFNNWRLVPSLFIVFP